MKRKKNIKNYGKVIWIKFIPHFLFIFVIEQRAIREAIARENQMHEMFADLDTNNDSL
jgi:hypothetical protein